MENHKIFIQNFKNHISVENPNSQLPFEKSALAPGQHSFAAAISEGGEGCPTPAACEAFQTAGRGHLGKTYATGTPHHQPRPPEFTVRLVSHHLLSLGNF